MLDFHDTHIIQRMIELNYHHPEPSTTDVTALLKGTVLPIDEAVLRYLDDPNVIAEAAEIKNGTRSSSATATLPGLAVQYAVAEFLPSLGYTVQLAPANVLHYDLVVNGVLVDVKCRFDGKRWQQSAWEAKEIAKTGEAVLYLCVDSMPTCFIFRGVCWGKDLEPGLIDCPFVTRFDHLVLDPI